MAKSKSIQFLDGRRAEAKRAIGTTLLLLDYAGERELANIAHWLDQMNRQLSQRYRAGVDNTEHEASA